MLFRLLNYHLDCWTIASVLTRENYMVGLTFLTINNFCPPLYSNHLQSRFQSQWYLFKHIFFSVTEKTGYLNQHGNITVCAIVHDMNSTTITNLARVYVGNNEKRSCRKSRLWIISHFYRLKLNSKLLLGASCHLIGRLSRFLIRPKLLFHESSQFKMW